MGRITLVYSSAQLDAMRSIRPAPHSVPVGNTALFIDDHQRSHHVRYTEMLAEDKASLWPDAELRGTLDRDLLVITSSNVGLLDPTTTKLIALHVMGRLTLDDIRHHKQEQRNASDALLKGSHWNDLEDGGRA